MATTSIQSNAPVQQPVPNQANAGQNKDVVGAGVVGGAEDVPGADRGSYIIKFGPITIVLLNIADKDYEIDLLEALTKMRDFQALSERETVTMTAEQKRGAIGLRQELEAQAREKQRQAQEKAEGGSIWDKIKLAFQALAAVLAIVVGSILIATGAGAVAGGLLIASGIIGLVMVADSIVQMTEGRGIAGSIAKAMGKSDEEIAEADMAFRISMTIAQALLAAGGGFLAGAPNTVIAVINGVQNVISITMATAEIPMSIRRYEAANLNADALETRADSKAMEALIRGLDEQIDRAIASLIAAADRFNYALDELSQTLSHRGESLTKNKFTA